MKKVILILFALATILSNLYGQERLFSLGYGKTFVTDDSSTLNITFDINKIPAQNKKGGGYFFVNEVVKQSKWRYYIKPTMDVNIGSGVASAPNNISVGLPVGVAYDFRNTSIGLFSWYFDGAPELVADKSFTNNLYYLSLNTYLKYEFINEKVLLNVIIGLSNANGIRNQINSSENTNDRYGRVTIPIYLKLIVWNASNKRFVNGVERGKDFKRVHWTNSIKFNHVYSDNAMINQETNYAFINSKFDFYLTPQLGINITYYNGNEEPIFKRNNSLTFGITLAR